MGTISGLTYQSVRFNRLYEPLAAFIATIAAYLIAMFFPGVSVETVILAGLIPLVPGLALTLGLSELATNDLASGTTRIMGAITVFVKIFFGIIIGKGLMSHYLAVPLISTNYDPGIWLTLAAPLFASLGFSVMFRAQGRDRFWIVLAALISFTVFKVCRISLQMDVEFAAAIAGLILGAGSNLFARTFKRPASITLLPGLLLLVPGSFGFIALDLMGKQNLFEGISTFFEMFVIAMGLVSGLLLGNIVITPRRSL